MNNALWSPRGAQAGERTRTAGGTIIINGCLHGLHTNGFRGTRCTVRGTPMNNLQTSLKKHFFWLQVLFIGHRPLNALTLAEGLVPVLIAGYLRYLWT